MSAQDLEPIARKMKTYATAWVHSKRKLSTRIDNKGNNNPTWNDKFVFRVNDDFLRDETSAITVEIYSTHWFRDVLVGTVRVLVGNVVVLPSSRNFHNTYNGGTRCVALQVRRPSGRPQGILNIGVAVLDSTMRSMPLYQQMSGSAVGFCDLMGMNDEESHRDPNFRHQSCNIVHPIQNESANEPPIIPPVLFRSRSEKSSLFDNSSVANSIIFAPPPLPPFKIGKSGSVLSVSEVGGSSMANFKKGKSNSIISGSEVQESKPKGKIIKKSSSVVSRSTTGNGKYILRPPPKPFSVLSNSEVGPSASEVAGMMMMERKYPLEDDTSSSILDEWSLNDTELGLRSKLERWRSEMPPLYDGGYSSSSSFRSNSLRQKRHEDEEDMGAFSIIGNIFGYECQCVCGPPSPKTIKAKSRSGRLRKSSFVRSSSIGSSSSSVPFY